MAAIDATNFLPVRLLLESGVHFGHKVSRLNPRMLPYIWGKRNHIHIIDVHQTIKGVVKAYHFLRNLSARGETVLFVGTKRQARAVVSEQAKRCGMPFASERWLGGTLTNYVTIRSRLRRLEEIERWETDGTMAKFSKKEAGGIIREKRKLLRNLSGIREMHRVPACLLVIDPTHEEIAVNEAAAVGAAVIALIDTDGDPLNVDIPIPCNDDSMKVVQVVVSKLADAIAEGRQSVLNAKIVAEAEAATT